MRKREGGGKKENFTTIKSGVRRLPLETEDGSKTWNEKNFELFFYLDQTAEKD